MDELQQEQRVLKAQQAEIEANKNFTYTVIVQRIRKISLQGTGTYVTNCL